MAGWGGGYLIPTPPPTKHSHVGGPAAPSPASCVRPPSCSLTSWTWDEEQPSHSGPQPTADGAQRRPCRSDRAVRSGGRGQGGGARTNSTLDVGGPDPFYLRGARLPATGVVTRAGRRGLRKEAGCGSDSPPGHRPEVQRRRGARIPSGRPPAQPGAVSWVFKGRGLRGRVFTSSPRAAGPTWVQWRHSGWGSWREPRLGTRPEPRPRSRRSATIGSVPTPTPWRTTRCASECAGRGRGGTQNGPEPPRRATVPGGPGGWAG